jgi:NhaP-type Na+/H+ or K+/H+ antiporter
VNIYRFLFKEKTIVNDGDQEIVIRPSIPTKHMLMISLAGVRGAVAYALASDFVSHNNK